MAYHGGVKTNRYSALPIEELRDVATAELTDGAWSELVEEFRLRGLDVPARPESYESPRERGADLGSRLFRKAVIGGFLFGFWYLAKVGLEMIVGAPLPAWPFLGATMLMFPVLDRDWSSRRARRAAPPAPRPPPTEPVPRNPSAEDWRRALGRTPGASSEGYPALSTGQPLEPPQSELGGEDAKELAPEVPERDDDYHRLGRFGLLAEEHWKKHLPTLYAGLKEEGKLHQALYEAQEKAKSEMGNLMDRGYEWGMAWEIVAPKYIHLDPAVYGEPRRRRRQARPR